MKPRNKKKKQKAEQRFHTNRVHAAISKPSSKIGFQFNCFVNKIIAGILEIWDVQVIACVNEQRKGKGFRQNNT